MIYIGIAIALYACVWFAIAGTEMLMQTVTYKKHFKTDKYLYDPWAIIITFCGMLAAGMLVVFGLWAVLV